MLESAKVSNSLNARYSIATTTDSLVLDFSPRLQHSPLNLQKFAKTCFTTETMLSDCVKAGGTKDILESSPAAVMHSLQADGVALHMVESPNIHSDILNILDEQTSTIHHQQNYINNEQTTNNKTYYNLFDSQVDSNHLNETFSFLSTVLSKYTHNSDTVSLNNELTSLSNASEMFLTDRQDQKKNSSTIQPSFSRRKVQYRKTRLCPWYFSGRCVMGNDCNYAHYQSELRGRPDLTRTRICPKMELCVDPSCRFAHYSDELRATGAFYKTKICKFWQQGSCSAGVHCRHAHGLEQLREPDEKILRASSKLSQNTETNKLVQRPYYDYYEKELSKHNNSSQNLLDRSTTTDQFASRTASILSTDSPQEHANYTNEEIVLLDALAKLLLEQTEQHPQTK